jgi:ribosomal protein S18 acetylase RimI-like enzyme
MNARHGSELDNPVWHSLIGGHSAFAEVNGFARRYHADYSVFGATDVLDHDGWRDLANLVGPGGMAVLFRRDITTPPNGFTFVFDELADQMIAPPDIAVPAQAVIELGAHDAGDMVALAELTAPGPLKLRAHELGRFIGVRDETGRLIAMAGERFRPAGFIEISGVCTHPDAQGQGLAAALTLHIAAGIQAQGCGAFLHVRHGNANAKRLYDRLGFTTRCVVRVVGVSVVGGLSPA